MVKRLISVLIIGLTTVTLACAQKISGVVIDVATSDSIPYATLYYRGHNVGVTSDLDDLFSVEWVHRLA